MGLVKLIVKGVSRNYNNLKKSLITKTCLSLLLLFYILHLYIQNLHQGEEIRRQERITTIEEIAFIRRHNSSENFDPNLPELRNRILRILNAKQFPSPFINNDAVYSNDINKRLFTDLEGGFLNVYTWRDLCSNSIDILKAKIEFPYNPWVKSATRNLQIVHSTENSGKRIFGYIMPPISGTYSFEVTHYGSIEFWLSPDKLPDNAIEYKSSKSNTLVRFSNKLFTTQRLQVNMFTVPLVANKKQYIEIIHASHFGGLVEVKWKEKYSLEYIHIEPEFMFPFVHDFGNEVVPETYNPPTLPLHAPSSELTKIMHPPDERNEIFIHSRADIHSSLFPSCYHKPSYVEVKPIRIANQLGIMKTYPAITLYTINVELFIRAAIISQELMEKVLNIFKQQLVASKPTTRVSRLLNMERLPDSINGDLFLVEVLVTYTHDQDPLKEHLVSEYVVLGHTQHPLSVLCHPVDMDMRRDTFVHFLVTHRKFPQMIREFIQNMEQVYEESRDENFGVIIVNYVTPLINVTTLLRQSTLKHWSVIDFGGPWEKTSAINVGIDSVKNPDDIIFITDLSIHYPAHLIDTIRKHTFQSYSGFAPIIFYHMCEFVTDKLNMYHYTGLYSITGYGLFSMYKSDWSVVGGMDSSQFKGIWGFEDNDLANRVLKSGYVLFRLIIRDFYHQNHTYAGLWDSLDVDV